MFNFLQKLSDKFDDLLTKPASPYIKPTPIFNDWAEDSWLLQPTTRKTSMILNTIFIVVAFGIVATMWVMSYNV